MCTHVHMCMCAHTHVFVKMLSASRSAKCVSHRADFIDEKLLNRFKFLGHLLTQFPKDKASEGDGMSH